MRPWRPPFHAYPLVRKGPSSSKRVSSQDPLSRKFWNFSLYSLNFCPKFSSQVPKFGNFQLTSSQIVKFSVHKPPNLDIFSSQIKPPLSKEYQFASPTLRKSGPHIPTWKKLSAPPPRLVVMELEQLKKVVCSRDVHGMWVKREFVTIYGCFWNAVFELVIVSAKVGCWLNAGMALLRVINPLFFLWTHKFQLKLTITRPLGRACIYMEWKYPMRSCWQCTIFVHQIIKI